MNGYIEVRWQVLPPGVNMPDGGWAVTLLFLTPFFQIEIRRGRPEPGGIAGFGDIVWGMVRALSRLTEVALWG